MYCHRCTVKMEGHQRLVFRRIDGVSEDAPGQHWTPPKTRRKLAYASIQQHLQNLCLLYATGATPHEDFLAKRVMPYNSNFHVLQTQ